ncbi:TraR/DksA family transcriptional regulator [Streptomyces sp. NPDC058122]|uniref:TraR/DksA family transcriptional regulator n=1 Tax=Streptomyces sp. NPDC058122 TaxID=3346349 RepID=UPI0036EEBD67
MSLDTPQAGTRRERLTAHEALQRLEHERSSRLSQLRAMDEVAPGGQEQAVAAQKETVKRVLAEVEAAFARVQDGSYGVCGNCSEAIPVERLEILPHTPFCVPCQRSAG